MDQRHAAPAREAALDALAAVRAGTTAEQAVAAVLEARNPSREDRALATEIVYGVVRWRSRLDAVVTRCLTSPGKKLHPLVRDILRMAAYQILLLDRIPPYAAVDEAVRQANGRLGQSFGGFVNAVLRKMLASGPTVDQGPGDDAASLADHYSHPPWLVERWIAHLGPEAARAVLAANNSAAALVIRVNTLLTTPAALVERLVAAGVHIEPAPPAPTTFILRCPGRPVQTLPGFQEGWLVVQESASQMVAPLLRPKPGDRILDACAAPGGKASHLAALAENRAELVVVDLKPRRVEETRKNLKRLGVTCARALRGDVTDQKLLAELGAFDAVLLDAPCTNLGVLRHNPEAKYRIREEDPTRFGEKQLAMLNALASSVKPGGALVYSVCTVTREETDEVVDRFTAAHPELSVDPISPEEASMPGLIDARGFLRTFPSPLDMVLDGFFAARFLRS